MKKNHFDLVKFFKTSNKDVFNNIMDYLPRNEDGEYLKNIANLLRELHDDIETHKAVLATGKFDGLNVDNAAELIEQNDELRDSLSTFDERVNVIQTVISLIGEQIEYLSSKPTLQTQFMTKALDNLLVEFSTSFDRTPYIASQNPFRGSSPEPANFSI